MGWKFTNTNRAVQVGPQVKSMPTDGILAKVRDINRSVARRAFELFQSRKKEHGAALDDWLIAESELLHSIHVDVEDYDDVIVVRAEVPGFRSDELRFCVEPFRITIAGAREISEHPIIRKMLYSDRCADQVLRVINCPIELNSREARASLKEGILELEIPKAHELAIVSITEAAFWILRPEDHRRWASVVERISENGDGSKNNS